MMGLLKEGVDMKKLRLATAAATTLALAIAPLSVNLASAGNGNAGDKIVGVWEVDAAAPYRPHLFTFRSDGTMESTNPTNVQENATAAHGGTNDSVGMGVWKETHDGNEQFIVGTFEELNAFADNHQPTDTLSVSFKLHMTDGDNGFDGPASAKVAGDTFPSHLTGARVSVDQGAVDALQ